VQREKEKRKKKGKKEKRVQWESIGIVRLRRIPFLPELLPPYLSRTVGAIEAMKISRENLTIRDEIRPWCEKLGRYRKSN
jgi:hypothetical protein